MKTFIAALASLAVLSAPAAEERRIAKEVVVRAPVEAVWKAWTTKDGLESFFAPEAFVEPRPDGPFQIHFNPSGAPGMKGADDMRVLAVQEGRMISFTWNAPPSIPLVRAQRTAVVVRMSPAGEGETRVTLSHGGWGDGGQWDQAFDYFDKAWGYVLGNLQKRFTDGPIDWKAAAGRKS